MPKSITGRNVHSVAQSDQPNVDKTPERSKRKLSETTLIEIATRKADSREPVLYELAALVRYRNGAITEPQLDIVMSVLSFMSAGTDTNALPRALPGWLALNGVHQRTAQPLLESAAQRLPADGWRHDYSIREIRAEFRITPAEEIALDLQKLVTEARRSMLRRRAEGARPLADAKAERQVKAASKPWIAAGLSRSAWYEQRRKAPAKAVAEAAKPNKEGTGRKNRIRSDRIEEIPLWTKEHYSEIQEYRVYVPAILESYSYYPVAPNPGFSAVPVWAKRTSKTRRLNALAARLGMRFTAESASTRPELWYAPGRALTAVEQNAYDTAAAEANESIERRAARNADKNATRKRRGEAPVDHDSIGPFLEFIREESADMPPEMVAPSIWEAVPVGLRLPVKIDAIRHHMLAELAPAVAVLVALETVKREAAAFQLIVAAGPLPAPIDDIIAVIVPGGLDSEGRHGLLHRLDVAIPSLPTPWAASLVLQRVKEIAEKQATYESAIAAKSAEIASRMAGAHGVAPILINAIARILLGNPGKPFESAVEQARFDLRPDVDEYGSRARKRKNHLERRGAHLYALATGSDD